MNYAEASYFEDYHFQHIAAWQEWQRVERLNAEARRIMSQKAQRSFIVERRRTLRDL